MFMLMKVAESPPHYSNVLSTKIINSPTDVLPALREFTNDLEQETVILLTLNSTNKIINTRIISIGLVNQSVIHPREIYRGAILDNAVSIIMVHNHPSGTLTPSSSDIEISRKLNEIGDLLNIKFMDHLIITKNGHISLKGEGYI